MICCLWISATDQTRSRHSKPGLSQHELILACKTSDAWLSPRVRGCGARGKTNPERALDRNRKKVINTSHELLSENE